MRVSFAPLSAVFLLACPPADDGQIACTTEARASVQLTVRDEAGGTPSGAVALYDAGDGLVPCEDLGSGSFVCGWEVDGPIGITVEAPGHEPADLEVDVGRTSDGCHVETVQQDVVLVASATAD